MEHVTAMIVEERKKDREEYKQLWRDTQRQISELGVKISDLGDELRESDRRLEQRIEQLAEESRAEDARLAQRIDALVSAMGEFIARQNK